MNNLYLFLIQSGINLFSLYGFYWLLMRRDTFYSLNRFYLLTAVVVSFIFPIFHISIPRNSEVELISVLETVVVTPDKVVGTLENSIQISRIIFSVYLFGVLIYLLRIIDQVVQTIILIKRNGAESYDDIKLVNIGEKYVPFSFFNYVFINKDDLDQSRFHKILQHEKAHVRRHHSLDLILVEILVMLQWFNPIIWLYKSSLKNIHEFQADAGVLSKGCNKWEYQQLLLYHSLGLQSNVLSNSFNQSIIKKRFIMMSKEKTKKIALLKMVVILPATMLFSLMFTLTFTENVIAQVESKNVPKTDQAIQSSQDEDPIFTVVEKMPDSPGGPEGRIKFIVDNIKYPEEARKSGIQGTVFITFVVEKDGKINNCKVLRGIGGGCDEEALRVISSMPDWTPGYQRGEPVRVQYNMPVRFRLDNGATKKEEDAKDKGTVPPPPPDKKTE